MKRLKIQLRSLWLNMVICCVSFSIPMQVFAEPSRPSRAQTQAGGSGMVILLIGLVMIAAGYVVYMKQKNHAQKPSNHIPQTEIKPQNSINSSNLHYTELDATVAMEATVGWNQSEVQKPRKYYVEIIKGVMEGRKYLITGQRTLIGRAEAAVIRYPSDTRGVSRNHCELLQDVNGLMVRDLGSSWGTYIEGKGKIPENQPVALAEGDVISLGSEDVALIIRIED